MTVMRLFFDLIKFVEKKSFWHHDANIFKQCCKMISGLDDILLLPSSAGIL